MKFIFFPFAQMVNYITYTRTTHPVRFALFLLIPLLGFFGSIIFLHQVFWVVPILILITIYILLKKNRVKTGRFLLLIVFIFLGLIYEFTTKYFDKELDITSYWSHWLRWPEKVTIYSGEPRGNYRKIADSIINASTSFTPANPSSVGGYENPNRVMLDPLGMGFVQEDIYKDDDKIREHINYIIPLYREKLHILYNKKSIKFTNLEDSGRKNYVAIGITDTTLVKDIESADIAVGKIGSATKLLSSIILSELLGDKVSPQKVGKRENSSFENAVWGIQNEKYDVIFFMAGQPIDTIKGLLSDTAQFGLIGIEPSFIELINNKHHTNYRNCDFSVKKDSATTHGPLNYLGLNDSLPTLGSDCYLIANKSVKPYHIKEFINLLNEKKDSIGLDFYNFKDNYEQSYETKTNHVIADLLFALTGGVTLGLIIGSFIFVLISSFYHDEFTHQLAAVIQNIPDESIPGPEKKQDQIAEDKVKFLKSLQGSEEKEIKMKMGIWEEYYKEEGDNKHILQFPFIQYYQVTLINEKIVTGMSKLVNLRVNINKALNEGRLNTEHFNDLLVRTDTIMDKLRKSLFLRLHELFNRDPKFTFFRKSDPEVVRILLKYVTSSYLNFDDYKKLEINS